LRPQGDSNAVPERRDTASSDAPSTTKPATSSKDDVENLATFRHASQREKPEPSDADLEAAIVAAMLDGRGGVAEMLAERLKERRHARAGVPDLDVARARRKGRD
jgi:hypothetical protein